MAIRIPGIIVRIINDAGIISPPLYQRYAAYIGEGDPYRLQTDVRLIRGAGDIDDLGSTTTVHDLISAGDLPGISGYVAGVDYHLVGNTISWNGAPHAPVAADYYYVTYTDTRAASAYDPMLYFNENLVYADHGNGLRTNGNINDVSVAASLGLSAGGAGVIVVQLDLSGAVDPDSPTNAELETAFIAARDQLLKVTDSKLFLVPLSSGTLNTTSTNNIFFNHAVLCSQPATKQERTVIGTVEMGTDYQAAATLAQSYAHERFVLPYIPDGTGQVVGYTGNYDTRFYGAALAGKLCSVGIGRNISDEIIPNVLFTDNFTPDEANYLVQRGVSPAKFTGEVVRNIMSITTDTTNALTEDLGVQDVKDYVKKYWREGLWTAYKNAPINPTLVQEVNQASVGILNSLVGQSIISEYRAISVSQDSIEPRKLLISGKIKPAFGLQWMDVTFTFVLSFK